MDPGFERKYRRDGCKKRDCQPNLRPEFSPRTGKFPDREIIVEFHEQTDIREMKEN